MLYLFNERKIMCGIAGFYCFKKNLTQSTYDNQDLLTCMHKTLSHRGKDNYGTYLGNNVGLSHARLSIRDVNKGNQPMSITINGYETAICYNGEIYNTEELIPELINAGYHFKTTSDTEVILYSFLHYGPDFVTKLNGIFAFAIWSSSDRTLYLYRDQVGVKPLFYSITPQKIVFASEPKSIFCDKSISPDIDLTSIQEILGIGPARTIGYGIFKGINEVSPGHYLKIQSDKISDITYWDLPCIEHTDSYEKTVEKVSMLVDNAIKRQFVSDVPICTFLSGGIDSSIVTAVAYNEEKKNNNIINTYSFDFKDNAQYFKPNSFQPERDIDYIELMLKKYPTSHHYLECDETSLFNKLLPAVDAKDYPGMADIDASLLYFCSLVSKTNKVALTGECADEIFGGYPWCYKNNLTDNCNFPWISDTSARSCLLKDEWISRLNLEEYSQEKYKSELNKIEYLSNEKTDERNHRAISYLNIKWFMQTLLERMDRTSMFSSLEARVPFADINTIEYVYNVPWNMKYRNNVEKSLLRDATKHLLPEKVLNRKKSPYPKTYHPGYERLLYYEFQKILENKSSPIYPLIDKDKFERFKKAPTQYGKPWYGQLMASPQLIAYYIQLNYWLEKYNLELP